MPVNSLLGITLAPFIRTWFGKVILLGGRKLSSKIVMEPNGEVLKFYRTGNRGQSVYMIMRSDTDPRPMVCCRYSSYVGLRHFPVERMPRDLVGAAQRYGQVAS